MNDFKEHERNDESDSTAEHGACVFTGKCHDCAQGMISRAREGFEYFDEEGDGRGFWFCRYCGSNHVTIVLGNGEIVEQGDLY
jgi:hypothetical protein